MITFLSDQISGNIQDYEIHFRIHASRRMFQRNISQNDVEHLLQYGTIIEQYDDDFPLPSLLLLGNNHQGRPLHAVVGLNDKDQKLIVITAYEPDPTKWTDNFSRRKL